MNLTRREFTLAAGALASACSKPAPRRPNILFIMTDDHSPSVMSCYGNRIIKTPHLDRLAKEGVRFTNSFVTNSLCAPGRASVLTGCYSHIHGIRGNSEGKDQIENMDPKLATYPQELQKAGYRTGIVGKWHLSHNPVGFDYWCVLPGQGVYFDPDLIENGTKKKFPGYCTDVTTTLALDFLGKQDDRPWCLVYQHKAPHRPFKPAPRHAHLFDDIELPYPETFNDDYATRKLAKEARDMQLDESLAPDYPDLPKDLKGAERKKWIYQRFVKDYYRAVAGVDENLGKVLALLDEKKMADDTLIVYTSDNGFFLGDHGWYDKRFMYEPSMRIPLIVRWPTAPKARLPEQLAANIDIAPTILDYAGVAAPEEVQGKSLRRIVHGGQQTLWRRAVYYTYYENSWALRGKDAAAMSDPTFRYFTPHRIGPHRGIRTETHKLIHYYTERDYYELFDLRKDPQELNNLYGRREEANLAGDMRFELQQTRELYGDKG